MRTPDLTTAYSLSGNARGTLLDKVIGAFVLTHLI